MVDIREEVTQDFILYLVIRVMPILRLDYTVLGGREKEVTGRRKVDKDREGTQEGSGGK